MEPVERELVDAIGSAETKGLACFTRPEEVVALVRRVAGDEVVAEARRCLQRLADQRDGYLPTVRRFAVVSPSPRSTALRAGQVLVHRRTVVLVVKPTVGHRLDRHLMESRGMGLLAFLLEGPPPGLAPLTLAERAEVHLGRFIDATHPAVLVAMMPRLEKAAAELARLDEKVFQCERAYERARDAG